MGEKRKYMRFDVLMDAICRKSGTGKKLKVNNFSKEGIGIYVEEGFDQDGDLEVEMMIPGDNIPVIFQGEVVWAKDTGADEMSCEGGMKFKNIKNNDKSRILEYIYHNWMKPSEDKEKSETEGK